MSFEKFYFYRHNIRIVRFHESVEFTWTFNDFFVVTAAVTFWSIMTKRSLPPSPIHSVNPILRFHLFHSLFFYQKFPPIYPSSSVQWYLRSFRCRKKIGNLVPHFFAIVNLFLLGAYFFVPLILVYFRYPLCVGMF